MRVVAFNSSPLMEKGNTSVILTPFLEGLKETGANVELFYTKKLNINPCQGDFNCWLRTPGRCHQDDDMQMLHPRMRQADVWVLATPVYVWGVSGPLKNLLDRVIPLVEPFIELYNDHCSHPIRQNTKVRKFVLVSNCGFWEMDNFEPLLAQMNALSTFTRLEFVGALLRPHGPALATMLQMGEPVDDVLHAAREAGRQLGDTGVMSPGTLAIVSRPLLPRERYLALMNQHFRQELALPNASD